MGEYYLMHSGRSKLDGAKVGSGRYPLGSGNRPFQGADASDIPAAARKRIRARALESERDSSPSNNQQNNNQNNNNQNNQQNKFKNDVNSISKSAKDITDAVQRIEERYRPKAPVEDLSDVSDNELRRKVERMRLEENYNSMKEKQFEIEYGEQKAQKTLATIGDTIWIAGSVASIAATILPLIL